MLNMKSHKPMKQIAIALLWLAAWQAAAAIVRNPVLLVGPAETVRALAAMAGTAAFWRIVAYTFSRIFAGFAVGASLGIALAVLSFVVPVLGDILSPFVTALKAVPVACFVVLLLIWAGTAHVALICAALVVFPVLYFNTGQGLNQADDDLKEIAQVFSMTRGDKIRHLYLPAALPFLVSALQVAVGMAWKSGVAAEVIAQRTLTLGNELYRAKVLLETDKLFAVTVTVVALSWLTERALLLLIKRVFGEMV